MKDTYLHKGLRSKLVDKLIAKGISDQRLLSAFMNIPRHWFLDNAFAKWAYEDIPFSIDANQTISQPYTVALQTTLLNLDGSEKVLEIGTGSGFQACVLAYMGVKVYTIERQEELFHDTDYRLHKLGFSRIRTLLGDGYKGASKFAPFDRILLTCGASYIPNELLSQLKIGGIMVVPLGEEGKQRMFRITKIESNRYRKEDFGPCSFVPFLKGVNSREKQINPSKK